jgi:hypothetical protein
MGFANYNEIISEITAGKKYEWDFVKLGPALEAAGNWASHWYALGSPGNGVSPATTPGTAYDDTAGGMFFPDTTSESKHILTFGAVASVNCSLMLYDRLVGVSGINLAATGNNTINSVALPRYNALPEMAEVEAWLEVTTATATTAPQISMNSYTNESGTAGRAGSTLVFPASATDIRWMGKLYLQAGDRGIKSVETVNVSVAGSAGVCNIILLKPLVYLPLIANIWNERDLVIQLAGLPRVYDGATLAIAQLATAATATNVWGKLRLGYS